MLPPFLLFLTVRDDGFNLSAYGVDLLKGLGGSDRLPMIELTHKRGFTSFAGRGD